MAVSAVAVLVGCAGAVVGEVVVIDRAPGDAEVRLTVEEAGFLAAGALVDIYGAGADPVPVTVGATRARLDGRPTWRLTLGVEVDVDRRRALHRWTMWVGAGPVDRSAGRPAVLRAVFAGR